MATSEKHNAAPGGAMATSLDGSDLSSVEKSRDASLTEKQERPVEEHEEPREEVAHARRNPHLARTVSNTSSVRRDIEDYTEVIKTQTGGTEAEYEYPKALPLALITISLCLAVFCMALDNTIISVAIPKITDQFKALDDVGWYGSSYLLCTCAFQLFYGKLYTFYSIKWVFLTGLFIFEVGSFICGIAPNSTALIIGRAVAGLGSAGIFSGAMLIVSYTVPLRQRPSYTGLIGAMYGIASVAGPLLGGVFTDKLTWRWCFYINLPFGVVTALFIIFFFKSPGRAIDTKTTLKEKVKQMDPVGTFFFVTGIVCLLLALQWGGAKYNWGNARIIVLFILTAFLLGAFVATQIYLGEHATVPPRVIKNRSIWAASLFGTMLGGAFFIFVYYLPIWFQAIKGVSAVKSGIMNLPLILGLVIVSLLSGGLVTAVGYYTPFLYVSTILMSIGAGLMTTFEVDTGHAKWIGYQAIFGAGVGAGMQQVLIVAQRVLPKKDVAMGTSVTMFCNTLGGALMISVATNVFNNQLVKNLQQVVPNLRADFVLSAGATSLRTAVGEVDLPKVLVAYNKALTQTFYASLALSILSGFFCIWVEWKSVKGKKLEPAMAA